MTWGQAALVLVILGLYVSVLIFIDTVPLRWTWSDLRHAARVAIWAFKNYAQLCGLKATLTDPATFTPFPPTVHAEAVRQVIHHYMEDFPSEH